jgi:hypothetical protein
MHLPDRALQGSEEEAATNKYTESNIELARKSAQEVEIDHLLAEEFSCDPTFVERFLLACHPPVHCPGLRVISTVPEPRLGGEGFGDLLIEADANGLRVALLIEDKVTASPASRQAERYSRHADRMRNQGWDRVWSILAAPAAYSRERTKFAASIDLETVAELLQSPDPVRLEYRRGIIGRALKKRAQQGVQIPDTILHQMKAEYVDWMTSWCAAEGLALSFPPLRNSYYDGDSWVEPIRHSHFPAHVWLRHRLWTTVKERVGQVDLIANPADSAERKRFQNSRPSGAIATPFSKGKGAQVSIRLPEMRQATGFDSKIALEAARAMSVLVHWYFGEMGETDNRLSSVPEVDYRCSLPRRPEFRRPSASGICPTKTCGLSRSDVLMLVFGRPDDR